MGTLHPSLTSRTKSLGSTDAAGRVSHRRMTWGAATDTAVCMSVPRLSFFFFFSLGFEPTWLDSHWLDFDSSRTGLIWPESGSIGWIGSFRPVAETYRNGRKKAEIVRAQSQMAPPSSADLHLGIFLGKKLEHHHSHSGFLLHPLSLSLSLLICFVFYFLA